MSMIFLAPRLVFFCLWGCQLQYAMLREAGSCCHSRRAAREAAIGGVRGVGGAAPGGVVTPRPAPSTFAFGGSHRTLNQMSGGAITKLTPCSGAPSVRPALWSASTGLRNGRAPLSLWSGPARERRWPLSGGPERWGGAPAPERAKCSRAPERRRLESQSGGGLRSVS